MSSSSSVSSVPLSVVNAYSIPPAVARRLKYNMPVRVWLVPCPHCKRLHSHGMSDGPRVPHCPAAQRPTGGAYVVKYAGEASVADIRAWEAEHKAAEKAGKKRKATCQNDSPAAQYTLS
jgi:hypothetical protein